MSRVLIERRLFDVAQRLRQAREELSVIDEQLAVLSEAANEARIRSLVSETPLAHKEHTEAQRHADAMARTRHTVAEQISDMERSQDELLDRLMTAGDPTPTD
ncbi:MAG: cytochrome P450 [Actinomycetota bacterium]|nr:cytochrome P450 [Actinomycetota bacterium]